MRSKASLVILLVAVLLLAAFPTGTAQAASLVEVTNFGTNPTGLRMYLYIPNNVAARPAILLADEQPGFLHQLLEPGKSDDQWCRFHQSLGRVRLLPAGHQRLLVYQLQGQLCLEPRRS